MHLFDFVLNHITVVIKTKTFLLHIYIYNWTKFPNIVRRIIIEKRCAFCRFNLLAHISRYQIEKKFFQYFLRKKFFWAKKLEVRKKWLSYLNSAWKIRPSKCFRKYYNCIQFFILSNFLKLKSDWFGTDRQTLWNF